MKIILTITLAVLSILCAFGQKQFDYTAKGLLDKREQSLEKYKGRPLLLELFSESCIVCFTKMPFMNELHGEFNDRISIVLLGDNRKSLPKTFERFKSKYSLRFDAIFDSALHKSFKAPSAPYYIWVDKDGNQIAETGPDLVTRQNIAAFLKGDYDFLGNRKVKQMYGRKGLLPVSSLQGLYHRSLFSAEIDSLLTSYPQTLAITETRPVFEVINGTLEDLFRFAFFGKVNWYRFDERYGAYWKYVQADDSAVTEELKKVVCYSLAFSGYRSPTFLQATIQADLLRAFGLVGRIEERLMPYWSVTRKDTSTNFLRSTHTTTRRLSSFGGLTYEYVALNEVLEIVEYNGKVKIPVLNETDIYWPIDLSFEAVMTNFEDVRTALEPKGLRFEIKKRPMQVLVVSKLSNAVAARKEPQQR
jgi:thiol-disulfide isomerase/thioredoxin